MYVVKLYVHTQRDIREHCMNFATSLLSNLFVDVMSQDVTRPVSLASRVVGIDIVLLILFPDSADLCVENTVLCSADNFLPPTEQDC